MVSKKVRLWLFRLHWFSSGFLDGAQNFFTVITPAILANEQKRCYLFRLPFICITLVVSSC